MNNTQSDHNSSDGASPLPVGNPSEGTVSKPSSYDTSTIKSPAKPVRKPTRKETAFAKYLVDNPTSTITDAYKAIYNWNGSHAAAMPEASRTLRKPSVQLELAKFSTKAESTVVEVMEYSKEYGRQGKSAYAQTALQAANSLLDRVHGKATQRVESTSTSVNLSIDLTSTLAPEE